MDNQHQKIKGYGDLSQAEIDLMNEIKAEGERLAALCSKVQQHIATSPKLEHEYEQANAPGRWAAMAATDLQVGIMKLVRAVARPSSF